MYSISGDMERDKPVTVCSEVDNNFFKDRLKDMKLLVKSQIKNETRTALRS